MGIISIEKTNRLFWLGRYCERVFTTLKVFRKYYDTMIDGSQSDYQIFCLDLGIPNIYQNSEDFINRYMHDGTNPNSLVSNMRRAYDNAIVLREHLTSETLSYVQMALDTLEAESVSANQITPMIALQHVIDDIYAFWGSAEDCVTDERARNLMKVGRSVERLDIYLRLHHDPQVVRIEYMKLVNRLYKTQITYDKSKLQFLNNMILERGNWNDRVGEMLFAIEGLFVDM